MSNLETLDLEPLEMSSEIGPKKKTGSFCLDGAENFSRFLRTKINGTLETFGPYDAQALQLGGPLSKRWEIHLNGFVMGNYFIEKCDEEMKLDSCIRFYRGRIPGMINKLVVRSNSEMLEIIKDGSKIVTIEDLDPIDSFVLGYSSMRGLGCNGDKGGELRRYDMHEHIPFP